MRITSVPFSAIPGQSSLFLEYQSDPLSLRKFYPNAACSLSGVAAYATRSLARYAVDRSAVCDALLEINVECEASEKALAGIELLRNSETVAVLTGQQAGLFSGPLYTIYKALSAVKLAEHLSAEGTPAVPIFWAATEDHDLDEVSNTFVIAADGSEHKITYDASASVKDSQVGSVILDDSISDKIRELIDEMPRTEFSDDVERMLSDAWMPGRGFGKAFLAQLADVLRPFGLIFVDPQNARLKHLSAPIFDSAIRSADQIAANVMSRSNELTTAGYHAQVLVGDDYFPLFWQTDDGVRTAIRKIGDGLYRSKSDKRVFSSGELLEIASTQPQRFSAGVMLRPVVQDYLFPTVCYFGGGAEVAYFAQISAVYETLGRPVTPVLHRQSFTIVESRHHRTLQELDLTITDLFGGIECLLPDLVEKHVSPDTAKLFAGVEENIKTELNRLDQALAALDVTLANNLAKRRRKMIYHIGALRKKAYAAELRKSETINGRLRAAFSGVYPNGQLQERSVNISTYLNKYGSHFVDWIYDAIDLDDRGHRVIDL